MKRKVSYFMSSMSQLYKIKREKSHSESPKIVKRSCLIKCKTFQDSYLVQLKAIPLNCDASYNVNKNCEIKLNYTIQILKTTQGGL